MSDFRDRQTLCPAKVDRRLPVVVAHHEDAGVRQVARADELAPWRPGAPDGERLLLFTFRGFAAGDERGDDVPRHRVEVVVRAEGVRWDRGDEACAVLLAVRVTQLPAGQLRGCVGG